MQLLVKAGFGHARRRQYSCWRCGEEERGRDPVQPAGRRPVGGPRGLAGDPMDNGSPNGPDFTPAFPAYTSGHATIGNAMFRTVEDFYHTDNFSPKRRRPTATSTSQ